MGGGGTLRLNLVSAWEQWVQKSYRKEMSLTFGNNQSKNSGRDNKSGETVSVVRVCPDSFGGFCLCSSAGCLEVRDTQLSCFQFAFQLVPNL